MTVMSLLTCYFRNILKHTQLTIATILYEQYMTRFYRLNAHIDVRGGSP